MSGFAEEPAALDQLAQVLERAAVGMEGPAANQPNPPNAGAATPAVVEVLEVLDRAVAAMVVRASQAADDVRRSVATYGQADAAVERNFRGRS